MKVGSIFEFDGAKYRTQGSWRRAQGLSSQVSRGLLNLQFVLCLPP